MDKLDEIGYIQSVLSHERVWKHFRDRPLGMCALGLLLLFFCIGLYAPLLASSKPLCVVWNGEVYFPLLRYLFFRGFFSKPIDLFYNLLMLTLPLMLFAWMRWKQWKPLGMLGLLHLALFMGLMMYPLKDPAAKHAQAHHITHRGDPDWEFEWMHMTAYGKLNLLLKHHQMWQQEKHLAPYAQAFEKQVGQQMPTLWKVAQRHYNERHTKSSDAALHFLEARAQWIEKEYAQLHILIPPLLRPFHWEEDAGGSQAMNQIVPWWELTRINRKDLVASLLFGIRVSWIVGFTSVALALLIGIPLGALAGYFAGKTDLIICRLTEIWEAMPTFFMLLFIVSLLQSKSIILVMGVLGLFSWTSFTRFVRGEVLKQRTLSYVLACKSQGYSASKIIFSHVIPNAIAPIITLLPFAMMGAISSEAGLSFLGLGEEGGTSWGILMDEGRIAFPGESYLLWPPALFLTLLLIAIAVVGDVLRDALDPRY